jgi:threonine dehydrogenase-like Zn-dependent dehydrogenase
VTGWHAAELAGVRADTVAVFGAGAVGLLAAYSARLRGASEVSSFDLTPTAIRATLAANADASILERHDEDLDAAFEHAASKVT